MSQFTIYRSTDGSAPTLSGTVGDLVNLLDKCLVAGYGSQSAAGWTKPLTGTNKAAFKQGGGNGFYLRVQDDAPASATDARLRGYETMSDVDTGTGLFPTVAQATNGTFARKSASANGTTRPWIVVADDRTVYVFTLTGDIASTYFTFAFGDFYSFVTADAYRTLIIGRVTENSAAANNVEMLLQGGGAISFGNAPANWVARNYLGTGTSLPIQKFGMTWQINTAGGLSLGAGSQPFPNPSDGGIYLSPIYIGDTTTAPVNSFRGKMRGIWQFGHDYTPLGDGDTFSGVGDLAGRTFMVIRFVNGSSIVGICIIETSNTLDTN